MSEATERLAVLLRSRRLPWRCLRGALRLVLAEERRRCGHVDAVW